jgi:hypothetical protein
MTQAITARMMMAKKNVPMNLRMIYQSSFFRRGEVGGET